MKHHFTGLDHPVIAVRDMEQARRAYERLGFIVPPRGRHPEWGTGNWCIQFASDYLELRGFFEASNAPQTQELLSFLQRREGLMGVAFGTTSARASHASLAAGGLHPRPVKPLTRRFELPEATVAVSFELCFLPREEVPGLMHVVACQHLTPELLRRPEWLLHPNGARGVAGMIAVAGDPLEFREAWERIFEDVRTMGSSLEGRVGRGRVLLLTPGECERRYPGADLPALDEWPGLVSVVLESENPARTRESLRAREIPCGTNGRVFVHGAAACGAIIEFSAGNIL